MADPESAINTLLTSPHEVKSQHRNIPVAPVT